MSFSADPKDTLAIIAKSLKAIEAKRALLQSKPDEKSLEEKKWAEKTHQAEIEKEKARRQKIENDITLEENEARKKYGSNVFRLTVVWLISVLVVVIASGIPILKSKEYFNLSENVVLALLGTTTINVLGLFGFVMKYLFAPRRTTK